MAQPLSQQEVDALLAGVNGEDPADGTGEGAGDGDALTPPVSPARAALVVSLCVGAALLVRFLHAVI